MTAPHPTPRPTYDLVLAAFCALLLISNVSATKLIEFGPSVEVGGFPVLPIITDGGAFLQCVLPDMSTTWECKATTCSLGRPLRIDGLARRAPAVARDDFPVPFVRMGARVIVPTPALRTLLQLPSDPLPVSTPTVPMPTRSASKAREAVGA